MSALHELTVEQDACDAAWRDGGVLELRVVRVPEFAWPAVEATAPSLRERLAAFAYRLATPSVELPWLANLGRLSGQLSRGAQPSRTGLAQLAADGFDTVINLRSEGPDQRARVESLGMRYLHFPMDPLAAPSHAQVLAFLHAATDPRHGRIFFHCYHGADRTGVLAACYRLAHDGWRLDAALAELARHRFHHGFQRAKYEYLPTFEAYWTGLDARSRARVLHQAVSDSLVPQT